jgi:hypothetical protein
MRPKAWEEFMVRVRDDYSAADLRRLARIARTSAASRRMLSLALVVEGARRAEVAKAGGMDRQTLCDWVHRFNAEGPEGLYDTRGPGPACRLSDEQQQELAALIETGPDLDEYGVVRWRLRSPDITRGNHARGRRRHDLASLIHQRRNISRVFDSMRLSVAALLR